MDSLAGQLLDRAQVAGSVRTVVTWADLRPFMCGIVYSATIRADDQETRLESGRCYTDVILRGMRD